jgi:putative tryptophan/tyrosine transport system substrate-binding protein
MTVTTSKARTSRSNIAARGQYDRLPELLSDLIRRQVKLIVASGGLVSAVYAKAATKTIPILFIVGFDPVKAGLVKTFADPGGNATGVSVYTNELVQKRLEVLHQVAPKAATIAMLTNPNSTGPNIEIEHLEAGFEPATNRLTGQPPIQPPAGFFRRKQLK